MANDKSTYSSLNAIDILKIFHNTLIDSGLLDILEKVKDRNPDDKVILVVTRTLRGACQCAKEIITEGGE